MSAAVIPILKEFGPMVVSAIMNMIGNSAQSSRNRSDFMFTHNLTNYPAQVESMRDAGLNPALAYGQISAPQGQSLGNYQSDFIESFRDYSSSREARANAEYRDAETDVLKAQRDYLIAKARNEARMSTFDAEHQQDRYDMEIRGKGLVNAGQELKNEGYQIENHGKIIDNEIKSINRDIAEFDKSIKKIDASKHKDFVESELKRIASNIALTVAEANALNQKLPFEISLMVDKMLSLKAEQNKDIAEKKRIDLENQVEEYLRRNGLKSYVLSKTDVQNIVGELMFSLGEIMGGW